ncbi:MAG: cyclic nucleotide-binding domain-containing protein [Sedimenticola sp.]
MLAPWTHHTASVQSEQLQIFRNTTMDLDLNKFRTLIPIRALYEESLLYLANNTTIKRYHKGERLFQVGDQDNDTLFLMSGEIQLADENQQQRVASGTDQALHALSNQKPRIHQGTVISESAVIARVDACLLGKLLAWGEFAETQLSSASISDVDMADGPGVEESAWMMAMLQTNIFMKLPVANIQRLFSRMQEVAARAGEVIINMGEAGDYYYIISQGRCRVTRPLDSGDAILAQLERCDSFGEEALISDAPRNATVTMLTDGKLMRLSKEDFSVLLEEPLLKSVDLETATALVRKGAIRVDVRMEDEFENCRMEGAINIPLHQLHRRSAEMDRSLQYIFCCDTGQRSSAATFLMNKLGFDVSLLQGGFPALKNNP